MILQLVLPSYFCNKFCLDFAANICVYFQYLFMHVVCANIFGANVLKPRFKIDVVIMIIYSRVVDPDPDPYWIRIQLEAWIRIRIRIRKKEPDPDTRGPK